MEHPISLGKRILIPINFSKVSLNLFDYGLELCNALNKSMMLLLVDDMADVSSNRDYFKSNDYTKEEITEQINKIYIKRAKQKYPAVKIHTAIKSGYTLDKVIKASQIKAIDQILIAKGSKTGLKAILYENISEIITKADCSILLVPENIPFHPFRHFLYLTDYKKADFLKLKRVIRLAKHYDSKITMAHISDKISEQDLKNQTRFRDLVIKKFDYDNFHFALLKDKDFVKKVNSYTLKAKVDIIVILKKDKSFLQNLFQPSITKNLVSEINLPVLIFHERIKK